MSKKNDQSNHYTTAVCPECGNEYQKYTSKQATCSECRGKVVGFLLPDTLQEQLNELPVDKRSQFVRDAIREKFEKRKP